MLIPYINNMVNQVAKLVRRVVERITVGKRSPYWPSVRRAHLINEGWCRSCQRTDGLEVRHIMPFHLDPSKELDETNLITLCENMGTECHLHKGHLGNWKNFNPDIRTQATAAKP